MIKPLNYIQHECEAITLDEEEQLLLKYLSEEFDFENNSEDFLDFSVLDPFDIKKEIIADHIKSLVTHLGKTHSEFCEELGWKKSRFSKVISGNANLTLKTIFEISSASGYDFDVVFSDKNKKTPHQPWQQSHTELTVFFEDLSQHPQLPIIDYIEPNNISEYTTRSDYSDVECLFAVRKHKPFLKDIYDDLQCIENSIYQIDPPKRPNLDNDDYLNFKIPDRIMVKHSG
ncbi:hypothetical protein D3C75_402700 [compost metagenome]